MTSTRTFLWIAAAWTLLIAGSLGFYVQNEQATVLKLAANEARTNIAKDLAFRRWATSHGGVYVEPTPRTPPNPWLAQVPARDLETTDGRKLTLMNPAYIMRQVMADYAKASLVKGHITALQLLNPANGPDPWEHQALLALQAGAKEMSEVTPIDGQPHLRLIQPMLMEEGCLKCHAWTGIPVGKVRGGISTAVPLAGYQAIAAESTRTAAGLHAAIWLIGLAAITVVGRRSREGNALRERYEADLLASRDNLHRLLNAAGEGIYGLDEKGHCTMINRAALDMLGYRDDHDLIGQNIHNLIHHTREDGSHYPWAECPACMALGDGQARRGNETFWRRDGTAFPVEVSANPIRRDGVVTGSVMTFADVSERRATETQLQLAAMVFESAAEGIVITTPDTLIVSANTAYCEITGYKPEEVLGNDVGFRRSDRHDTDFFRTMWTTLNDTGRWQGEIWNCHKSGDARPEWLTINAVKNRQGRLTHYIAFYSDISALRDSQRQLEFLATHDPLTGLTNRMLFRDQLRTAQSRAARMDRKVAVMFIDLDDFKHINDSLGHDAGDDLLKQVAKRLQARLRPEDVLARWGGDEFILLAECQQCSDAANLASRLLEGMQQPYQLNHNELFVSASIGISLYPDDASDFPRLLQNADTAMYRAKELGKNSHQFFEPDMNFRSVQRTLMEASMRRGLTRGEFLLHYQPQVDIRNGMLAGLEALIRWRHPEQGLVSPALFIPVAEDSGLIGELSEWVVNEACRQIRAWIDAGLTPPRVAVNFSPRHFRRGNVPSLIQSVLSRYAIDPRLLMIELTENALMNDRDHGVDILTELKRLGISLSIDDFGTGYSSLGYLKRFPIDEIKIDKQFVDGLPHDHNDAAIANAILGISRSMGLEVVAEGVENSEQLAFLREAGCQMVQGYHFSKPLPAEEILLKLLNRRFPL